MQEPAPGIPIERLVAHREWVRRVARALVRDESLAEDLEQGVWVEALERPPRTTTSLGGWLAAAMRHNLADLRRSEGRRRAREEAVARPERDKSAADLVAEAESLKRVVAALLETEEPYRTTLLLRFFEDLPLQQVADRQGVPLETARTRLRRALQLIRERFDRESGGDRKAWCLALLPLAGEPGIPGPAPAVAGAAATAQTGVALGGLLMAHKVLASVVAVVALAGVGWLAFRPSGAEEQVAAVGAPVASTPPRVATTEPPPPTPLPDHPEGESLPPPVDLSKCDRDLDLFGVVVDDAGAPVPGATVECVSYPWRRMGFAGSERQSESVIGPSTRSAVDGSFAVRLRRGELVALRGTAPGFGQGDLAHCQAGERVQLVMRRAGGTLLVRAFDEGRRPVAAARLRLWGHQSVYGTLAFERAGVTAEDGTHRFENLPAGRATLSVQHAELGQPDWGNPVIPGTGVLEWEVVLPQGRTVSGLVTDAETGRPIAGSRVGSNWVMDRPVLTGEDGRYRFPGWTGRGTSVLTVMADGYGGEMRKVPAEGDLDFPLEPGFRASGRVVSADGTPVPGARVSVGGAWQEGDRYGRDRAAVVADDDGRFAVGGLSRRTGHDLLAQSPGHARAHVSFEGPTDGSDARDLGDVVLAGARAIEGRAEDARGMALASEPVVLTLRRPADRVAASSTDGDAVPGMGELRRTDDLGRFRFPDLPPGRYGLKLNVSGSPVVEAEVDLPADRDVLDVRLRQAGRSVTLIVTDLAGRPLEGITVHSPAVSPHPTGGGRGMTNIQELTDAEGRVTFRNLPDAAHGMKGLRFSVQPVLGEKAPPYAWLTTEPIVPEGQVVTVALKPVAVVGGRVLGPDGGAIPGLMVNAVDASGKGVGVGECRADGTFSMRVPAGEPLTIRVPGHRKKSDPDVAATEQSPYRGELTGITGPAADLLLRVRELRVDGSVDVRVVDLEGRPVPEFEVGVMRINEPQRTGRTDSTGQVRFEGLLEDTWFVAPRSKVPEGSPEDLVGPATVEIVPSGQQVVLRFRKGLALEGSAYLPDGTPAAGAAVWAQFQWGSPMKQTKTDAGGRFRIFMGEGDVAFLLTASWWNDEKAAFSADLRDVKAGGAPIEIKLEPMKPR